VPRGGKKAGWGGLFYKSFNGAVDFRSRLSKRGSSTARVRPSPRKELETPALK